MNNKVVFAAAGHGKTFQLCAEAKQSILNSKKYVLLISYTNEGVKSLENEYKKQNSGVLDSRIIIKTWYNFLLSDFIKPYQCLLKLKYKFKTTEFDFPFPEYYIKSIDFQSESKAKYGITKSHVQYYLNSNHDIYRDKVSELAYLCNQHASNKVVNRIEELYSHIYIDELQDYAGWDLEIIELLFQSQVLISCVGDYKQATFRTNNSQKNKKYRDDQIVNFFAELEGRGICSILYKNTSRRLNQEVCTYVNSFYNDIKSEICPDFFKQHEDALDNEGVYIIDIRYLKQYCEYYRPTILRYNKNSKVDFYHEDNVFNYGNSKGSTFERIVILPVKTIVPHLEKPSKIASRQTKAKFYVACTRAKRSIVFAISNPKETEKFKFTEICIGDATIPAYRYCQ